MPSIQEYYEEEDSKQLAWYVIIGGAYLPTVQSIQYEFAIGSAPTATIVVNRNQLPAAVKEEASVQIWLGFRKAPITESISLVFGGAKVDSVSRNGPDVTIECVMDGPAKLNYTYNRHIAYDFADVEAQVTVVALMDLAGVHNYYVDLPAWVIGTAVPRVAGTPDEVQFSTYGEAVNKVAEVDASPWYAMPTGQVRVEIRNQIPADTARRTYFSSVLVGTIEVPPAGITNPNARPRILSANANFDRASVSNWIEIDGAVVTEFGPNGEQNSHQIVANDDAQSGNFANGAPWITTPPLFQQFTLSNELIDTDAKAAEVVARYLSLRNRLFQEVAVTVPADPDVFLGETVEIKDPKYTGIDELYFLRSYRTTIESGNMVTNLELVGGQYAGTAGHISPFAEFIWKYSVIHNIVGIGQLSAVDLGPGCDIGSKLCEDLPSGTGDSAHGGDLSSGQDMPVTMISFDGTPSQDFDGQIVSYAWEDDQTPQHTGTGPYFTVAYNPEDVNTVQMTLTVTDNDGRTNALTKTVYVGADHIDLPPGATQDPPMCDTQFGGGTGIGDCCVGPDCSSPPTPGGGNPGEPPGGGNPPVGGGGTGFCNGIGASFFLAAGAYAMFTPDNRAWNDLSTGDAGVSGEFISVGSLADWGNSQTLGLFGTDAGEIYATSDCVTGVIVAHLDGEVRCIQPDTNSSGGGGGAGGGHDKELTVYTQSNPGTLTMVQAFQQALAVGFDITPAKIAVAIMIAESGLISNALNTNPGPPTSHDRGIAQINSVAHPEISDICAYDTACAILAMYKISKGGTDFSPWSTYAQKTYLSHLAAVDSGTEGIHRPPGSTAVAWAGTSTGKLYKSAGGTQFTLQAVGAGPINAIGTPAGGSLWLYGGDTEDINTLIQIVPDKTGGTIVPLFISGDLADAIAAAGPGFSISSAAVNQEGLLIAFNGGVVPPVWINGDPAGSSDGWEPATGIGVSGIDACAPGFGSYFVVAGASTDYISA
jgi:hypothetical protein